MLSIVVLAWNNLPLTQACVASLRETTDVDHELIIVDNGSTGEAASWAEAAADIPVLHPRNLGFAPGMNSGLAAANGDLVAFVNNDTVFPDRWASMLTRRFIDEPTAGLVLPAVTAAGNPYSVRSEPGSRVLEVPSFRELPSGVVYLMPSSFIRSFGGWDERYTIASREDLDLLFMTWCLGRSVLLDERVLVHHESQATARTALPNRDDVWARNWERFIEKWTGPDPTGGHPDTVPERVQAAQVAAHWLGRWYEVFTERQSLRSTVREQTQAIRNLERRLGQSQGPQPDVVSRLAAAIRRRTGG